MTNPLSRVDRHAQDWTETEGGCLVDLKEMKERQKDLHEFNYLTSRNLESALSAGGETLSSHLQLSGVL